MPGGGVGSTNSRGGYIVAGTGAAGGGGGNGAGLGLGLGLASGNGEAAGSREDLSGEKVGWFISHWIPLMMVMLSHDGAEHSGE